jgi:hypothetical protein
VAKGLFAKSAKPPTLTAIAHRRFLASRKGLAQATLGLVAMQQR